MKIVECIPNFSEARRSEVMDQIVEVIQAVEGVQLLDRHSDLDHNRTVLTFVGTPEAVSEAAYIGIKTAAELIDLNVHQGEHPRIGATDVVPFVPISGVSMQECVELSRKLGQRVAADLNIPVYFYEEAALRPDRRNLEDIRRGEFEGLKDLIAKDPSREPDLGPKVLGPAGATVIGAREPLIAYNIYLTSTEVGIAEKIARRVRNSSGGFHYVKAMGVLVNGMAQVSMNLTNFRRSPIAQVTEMVRREAQRYGVGIHHSEVVGLIPNQALINAASWYLQMDGFDSEQLLDIRLFSQKETEMKAEPEPQADFIEAVAEGTPTPGGGSAAASTGALAAALVMMVSRLTIGKAKYASAELESWEILEKAQRLKAKLKEAVVLDSQAFEGIMAARKLPKESEEQKKVRADAIHSATLHAAEVPLEAARDCSEVLELAGRIALIGNINAVSDAGAGANLAYAGLTSAGMNVRINLLGIETEPEASKMLEQLNVIESESETLLQQIKVNIKNRSGI